MEARKRERRRREEERTEETSPEPLQLPPEIIREILIRLPAKSIGRFRCVSKLFRSLSSDPSFAKSQLDLTIRNDTVHPKLLVSSLNLCSLDLDSIFDGSEESSDLVAVEKLLQSGFDQMINSYWRDHLNSMGPVVDEDDRCMRHIMRVKTYQRTYVKIIGSSNGLVCITPWEGAVFLYNPTTGDSKRLPEELSGEGDRETHGFGFDDHTDDYKVVKIVADVHRLLSASVYSLKSDSWRRICDLNYGLCGGFIPGVNVNGTVHWLLSGKKERVILAFDLKTEEFREMPLPVEAQSYSQMYNSFLVGNLGGRLCVNYSCNDDLWVMNEYGVWRRIRINLLYKSCKRMCSTNNSEEVLMVVDGDIVLYNIETNASRNLVILRDSHWLEADTYVESLISPN